MATMTSTLPVTDIRSTQVQHTHSHSVILQKGVPVAAGVGSLSTFSALLPILTPITLPVLLLSLPVLIFGHAIFLRAHLVDPVLEHCDRSRRFATRWSLRLLYWIAAIWGYLISSFAPGWGLVVVPAVFASVTVVSYKYTHWQLQQARQKKTIHFFQCQDLRDGYLL